MIDLPVNKSGRNLFLRVTKCRTIILNHNLTLPNICCAQVKLRLDRLLDCEVPVNWFQSISLAIVSAGCDG
jgi:hypothetical protein